MTAPPPFAAAIARPARSASPPTPPWDAGLYAEALRAESGPLFETAQRGGTLFAWVVRRPAGPGALRRRVTSR